MTTEQPIRRVSGYAAIAGMLVLGGVGLVLGGVGLALIVAGAPDSENGDQTGGSGALIALGVVVIALAIVSLGGLIVVQPNQAKVVTLFGRYRGTVREAGFHWINPLTSRTTVSLRVRALRSIEAGDMVRLTPDHRAQLVSNLLVVLVSDRGAQPIVNSGA